MNIVVVNSGTNTIGAFLSRGDQTFVQSQANSTRYQSRPYSVVISDFNHDDHLNIAAANYGTNSIGVFLGYGNGAFATAMAYSTGTASGPYTVAINDFNDDNIPDLMVANSGTSNILFLYGYEDETFGNGTQYSLGYDYRPYSLAVKDLNQDNWVDIVIVCLSTDRVETLIKTC